MSKRISMKKLLFFFIVQCVALTATAQDWILASEGHDSFYYINSTIRKARGYYIAYEKCVPKDLNAERSRLVREMSDNKFYRYVYSVVTELVDIEQFRTKSLSFAYYDTNGNVLDTWECENEDWRYAKPGTILEGVCETVDYIVNGSTGPTQITTYSDKDVADFKKGLFNSSRQMSKSVPVQINANQTLIAVGVLQNKIVYKYEIKGWDGRIKMTKEEIAQQKKLEIENTKRLEYASMYVECMKRTGFSTQTMFFTDRHVYIGDYTIEYKDFVQ